ncbi:RNA-binding protein [Ktedonosporobacter rubrisoli]|uniref:RNA-binding protein n=1 Tax=Ktedonosporobacter rubrisoli TaxID=2509675 RepID=A0A4V0Z052_KTERU|nr:RNA-binding protein [Ktedonosporobacter rubrisoli]QBD82011.1 RNA-binding protein [Ktedonosporobacter rubrisoli]
MRLYVGGLPYQTNEQELSRLFEQIGTVTDVRVITDRETGRSKGFGFIEMSSLQEGQSAIEQLNGAPLDGRTIVVSPARERQSTGSRWQSNSDSSRY